MRDNQVVQFSRAFLHEDEFRAAVDRIAQSLAPDVERIITKLEDDWNGELYADLLVIVSDDVVRRDQVHEVANQVRKAVNEQIDPRLEWGIRALVGVRTRSEQAEIEQRNVA